MSRPDSGYSRDVEASYSITSGPGPRNVRGRQPALPAPQGSARSGDAPRRKPKKLAPRRADSSLAVAGRWRGDFLAKLETRPWADVLADVLKPDCGKRRTQKLFCWHKALVEQLNDTNDGHLARNLQGRGEGLLQSDGYGAYDHIGGPKLVHAACWAHARRKFFEAVKLNPEDTTSIQIVAQMDELFGIDAQARQEGLSQIDRHVLRLDKSKPLLEEIKTSIQADRTGALPKSALAKACDYTLTLLEPAQPLPGISGVGIEQQLGRERDAPGSSWPTELDPRRQ
jgi:hypothetical protein